MYRLKQMVSTFVDKKLVDVAMALALHELLQLSDAWMSVGVVLCTTLLLFVLYTHHKVNQRDKSSAGVLPPGSVGWPLLGETIPFARNPVKYSTTHSIQYSSSMYTYTHARTVGTGVAWLQIHK